MNELMRFTPGDSCEICGTDTVDLKRCDMCGAFSCEECISEDVCFTCMEARCFICEDQLASRACNECGRLVCEDHGTKENEATICEVCQAN
ncbi:MAG: hypothetical protein ACW98J_00580 [Candidatus Thorarchaeota archaeon]